MMSGLDPAEIEQTKLLANALDRASTACFTVGIATPLAGYAYSLAVFSTLSTSRMMITLAAWFLGAIALHYRARRILRRLA